MPGQGLADPPEAQQGAALPPQASPCFLHGQGNGCLRGESGILRGKEGVLQQIPCPACSREALPIYS